jgi:hypothetical protein
MFGLFEAMSAIELMDPKMDAGMQCNRLKGRTLDGSDQTGNIFLIDIFLFQKFIFSPKRMPFTRIL